MQENEGELLRIAAEAAADEAAEDAQGAQAEGVAVEGEHIPADLAGEFADFLDLMAKIAGHGLDLPSIPARFNHQANADIAAAAIKLCQKYGIDARAVLIGEDSTIGAWLGLGVAVGLPGYGCWTDHKKRQAEKKKEAANDGETDKRASE